MPLAPTCGGSKYYFCLNGEGALVSPAMGHWDKCLLDFQLFNFYGRFRAAQTLTLDSLMWLPNPEQNAYLFQSIYLNQAKALLCYGFVALFFCMNSIIFLCVTLKLFFLSFVPLLHATAQHSCEKKNLYR